MSFSQQTKEKNNDNYEKESHRCSHDECPVAPTCVDILTKDYKHELMLAGVDWEMPGQLEAYENK